MTRPTPSPGPGHALVRLAGRVGLPGSKGFAPAPAPRRGMVLPIVLICCVLISSMVITYQFASSSDYKQVGRLLRAEQGAALAELAADETAFTVEALPVGGGPACPPWARELLDELEAARAAAGASRLLDVRKGVDFTAELPMTRRATELSDGLVEVSSAIASLGPFRVLGGHDTEHLYGEPLFGDGAKDRLAWDLRGPFDLEILVKSSKGPFDFGQRFLRGQEMELCDTTPPACEFVLFGYMPPPDEDHALNDLQRGGRLTVLPGAAGRTLLRGPLLVVAEDAPSGPPQLGGGRPASSPGHYPDTRWTGWATVPSPRTAQHPDSSAGGFLSGLLANLGNLLPGLKSDVAPRRPLDAASHSVFETSPFSLRVCVRLPWPIGRVCKNFTVPKVGPKELGEISLVAASGLAGPNPAYRTVDLDECGYFPPTAYFYGPLSAGRQLLTLKPRMVTMHRGVLVPDATGQNPEPFVNGARPLQEGDCLQSEPVFRTAAGGGGDAGLLGLYGIARLDSRTYSRMPVRSLVEWFIRREVDKLSGLLRRVANSIGIGTLTDMAMSALNLSGDLEVLFRRFYVESGWAVPPGDLDAAALRAPLDAHLAAVVPHGFYWHEDRFWESPATPATMTGSMRDAVRNPLLPWSVDRTLTTFVDNPTGWQQAEAALPASYRNLSHSAREWCAGPRTKHLMRNTAGKDEPTAFEAVRAVLDDGLKGGLRGLMPLASRRPAGAFGEFWPEAEPVSEELLRIAHDYPNGFYPPKQRAWEMVANRSYPDLATYLAAETVDGVLELKGAVLIRRMDYPSGGGSAPTIVYRGRGLLVTVTEDEAAPARLAASVQPLPGADPAELVLAHRVSRRLVEAGKLPPLRLGSLFVGSVVSDTGVAPAGGSTLIDGNLVVGLLNKRGIPASTGSADGVTVRYRQALQAAATGPRAPYWAVHLGGEVTSVEPGP